MFRIIVLSNSEIESETMSERRRRFWLYTPPSKTAKEGTRAGRLSRPQINKEREMLAPELNSVYYYWFAFLKRNKDFEKTHRNGGKGKFKEIYENFGNLYKYKTTNDFHKWFNEKINDKETRGEFLFAEAATRAVEEITDFKQLGDTKNTVTIKIGLENQKKYIIDTVRKILKRHEDKIEKLRSKSTARYKIGNKLPLTTLYKTLRVYDYVKSNKKDDKGIKITSEEICTKCGITVNKEQGQLDLTTGGNTETEKKKNKRIYQQRCGKALGRYKAQAEKYIKSALSDNFLSNI